MGRYACYAIVLAAVLANLSACDRPAVRASKTTANEDVLVVLENRAPNNTGNGLKQPPDHETPNNAEACKAAGGRWARGYRLGVLYSEHRTTADDQRGETSSCWMDAPKYADGGKLCTDQSECEGNCFPNLQTGEGRCQATAEIVCTENNRYPPVYKNGKVVWGAECPIP